MALENNEQLTFNPKRCLVLVSGVAGQTFLRAALERFLLHCSLIPGHSHLVGVRKPGSYYCHLAVCPQGGRAWDLKSPSPVDQFLRPPFGTSQSISLKMAPLGVLPGTLIQQVSTRKCYCSQPPAFSQLLVEKGKGNLELLKINTLFFRCRCCGIVV